MRRRMLRRRFALSVVALLGLAVFMAVPALASPAAATREMPASVESGNEFGVTVTPSGCGAFGQVEETLPDGFTYLSCTPETVGVEQAGSTVKFTFLGSDSFTYRVRAPEVTSTTSYTFLGIIKDENRNESPIDDSGITVSAFHVSATRTLPSSVASGQEFDVAFEVSGCGAFGQVVEMLPAGFAYLGCTPGYIGVELTSNTVKFTFLGAESFSYRVQAPSVAATTGYTFQGVVKDEDKVEHPMATNNITVNVAGGGGGGGGGAPPPPSTIEADLFGDRSDFMISQSGKILERITATSADGSLTLTIPKNTVALDGDGNSLSTLAAERDGSPPPSPDGANVVGLAYDFGPDGATFNPPAILEYTYDPADIPEGVAEGDLVLAYYDEDTGQWVELDGTVDPVTNTITTELSHFTTFAVIAPAPPAPQEPEPAAFTLSGLTVQPEEVRPQEAVSVSLSVHNSGGLDGNYTVVLEIDGAREAEETVTVAAGDIQELVFSVAREDVGYYRVAVEGLSAEFTVVVPEPEPEPQVPQSAAPQPTVAEFNWPVLAGIIAGVIIVGLFVFFLLVRRRRY